MKIWILLISAFFFVSGKLASICDGRRCDANRLIAKHADTAKNVVNFKTKNVSKRKKLFGTFAYKGITVNFAKSIIDPKSGQVGLKIPVTPNFPVYDSRVYLPRITYFIGIAFPLHLKMSLSVTVHMIAVLQGLKMLRRMYRKDLPKLEPLKFANSKDEIKRIGFNINVKIDGKGVRSNIGPAIAYLPDYATVTKLIPLVLVIPVLLVSMLNYLLYLLDFIIPVGLISERNLKNADELYGSKEYRMKLEQDKERRLKARKQSSLRVKLLGDKPLGLMGIVQTWQQLSAWMALKKPAFQITLGQYWGPQLADISRSSNLVFDLQPFYPFEKQWQALLSAVSAAIVPVGLADSVELEKAKIE